MKTLLIVVDYQKDFVDGALASEPAKAIENNIAGKIDEYRKNGADIAFTFDTHGEDYLSTQEGRKLPVTHCVENSDGWALYGKVGEKLRDTDRIFKKATFGSAELFDFLRASDYEKIELCGVVTDICVVSNAILAKTALPECEVFVDARCVAGTGENGQKSALDVMSSVQINVYGR